MTMSATTTPSDMFMPRIIGTRPDVKRVTKKSFTLDSQKLISFLDHNAAYASEEYYIL